MPSHTIKKACGRCSGTGLVSVYPFQWVDVNGDPLNITEIECSDCQGTGKVLWGYIDSLVKCPTSLILESTDQDEYAALSSAKKTLYALFVSAGTLDMSEGTRANTLFLTVIFPAGTVSNTAFTNALAEL
jgi:hypothetical protein